MKGAQMKAARGASLIDKDQRPKVIDLA